MFFREIMKINKYFLTLSFCFVSFYLQAELGPRRRRPTRRRSHRFRMRSPLPLLPVIDVGAVGPQHLAEHELADLFRVLGEYGHRELSMGLAMDWFVTAGVFDGDRRIGGRTRLEYLDFLQRELLAGERAGNGHANDG